jgi:thiamine pyrophosphate-dependent acetolactate synthase large subunit-like protein
MKTLVRQLLDEQISRRGFVKEMMLLGVSLSSAQALLSSIADADAAEIAAGETVREVTGNGSDVLIDTLLEANVKYVFHGCGAGTNRFFDSILKRPQITNFLATNEGQCVAAAEAYNIASGGELGVAIIPKAGLGNAQGNIYNALINRSPVLILTARDSAEFSERRGDLELVDWHVSMDPFMRSSYRIDRFARVTEFTRRAVAVAHMPPGGPTFLQMTENCYTEQGTAKILPRQALDASGTLRPKPELIDQMARMLIESERPVVTLGHEVTRSGAQEKIIELAELLALPMTGGLSGFADFPTRHTLYLGRYTPFLPQNKNADLYVSIGSQMPDEGSYVHRGPPPATARTAHMTVEPELLGMYEPTDLKIVADVNAGISDLIESIESMATKRKLREIRAARFDKIKAYTEGQTARRTKRAARKWDKAPITSERLCFELNAALEPDAIILAEPVQGARDWMDLGYGYKTFIGGSGATVLGWATGAALGAKLAQPDRQVVAVTGDGAFMFQHNLWGLARHQVPVLVVIYNNFAYNLTRAFSWLGGGAQAEAKKDMLNYLGDPNVDFTHIASAYSIDSAAVSEPGELKSAIEKGLRATAEGKPYLLDVHTERWGRGGELTWHPDTSVANMRTRNI